MKVAVTTNARLYKNSAGEYYALAVYDYSFFLRYLEVFEKVKLIAHVESKEDGTETMLRIDGPNLEVFEVPFPHGKIDYLKKYAKIKKVLKNSCDDCDAAILRIPDQLAFQLYEEIKGKFPIAVEVTTHSWDFYNNYGKKNSLIRIALRTYWDFMQKRICKKANGTAYVTKEYIQKRYPPNVGEGYFTTSYTDTNIDDQWLNMKHLKKNDKECVLIHVATSIAGNAKGHRELLIALGELVKKGYPVKAVLVGNGELNEECRAIVERYNIQDRIRKTGVLAKSELMKELSEADIFVFPSYVEGLPRVVVEAIGMGLACVATDLPGNRELIDEEFLVPVFDTELLEQKIETLLDDEIRTAVGKRNRLVAEEYHVDKIKKKRKEFYLQLKEMVRK